ncbi:MAG TPA: adenylate/guanylate cyclase domain-containing protein [Blastocatellia bacterium]|nr:adenylate/guanylate cyclase domain-containing protein [Blastocatellia bacterium]
MSSKLIITNTQSGRSFEYEIARDETRIGRAADRNDVVLNDGQVSREHVVIRRDGHTFLLIDLGSANGTTINGMRIKEHVLRDGDWFSISKYNLQFKSAVSMPPIKFGHGIGDTVVMRTPGEIAAVVPKIDQSAIQPSDSKSVLDYVEALRKKAETLARIYELNQLLASDFSQEDIFKKVSEMVFRLTTADRFLVLLKDPDSGELVRVAAEFRESTGSLPREDIAISRTVVDRVMAERVSLLSFDTHSDERFAQAKSIVLQNITSVMCSPLLSKDKVLGVIYVDCREAVKLLRDEDLELLNAVAAETSIAVDNAMTHKRLVREELARAKFRRFMPPHVVDEILKSPNTLSLGGTNSCITVLFSDIRGFTSMSEMLSPQVVVQILNEYFADMTPIVFEYQGLLDKFMGDGLMALFGVPYPCDEAASNAVAAAVAMQRRMAKVNEDLVEAGLSEIGIGIGINTGTATVGYIGSRDRTDYTAIGDTVNLGARLEKQAQAGQIIISSFTREAIGDSFPLRPSTQIRVKGRKEPVQIYEVLWQEAIEPVSLAEAEEVLDAS